MKFLKVNCCFWFILLLSGSINGQEIKIPIEKEIKIVNEDSLFIAHVLISNPKSPKIDNSKRYYWIHNSSINSNIGGYYGKLLHGNFKVLKNSNLVESGNLENGLKVGTWNKWRLNGEFLETMEYKNGVKHGNHTEYDIFGNVIGLYLFKKGDKDGKYRKWNRNGQIIEKGRYKSNKKNGRIVVYNDNGSKSVNKYREGALIENNKQKQIEDLPINKKQSKSDKKRRDIPNDNIPYQSKKSNWWMNIFKNKTVDSEI